MAGVRMRVEAVGLGQLREELAGFAARGGDLTPAMRSIGEALLTETRERFRAGKDPRGQPWAPLSATTKRKKKRNKEKILIYRGHLLGLNPCPDGEGIKTAALDRRRRGILVYSGMNK